MICIGVTFGADVGERVDIPAEAANRRLFIGDGDGVTSCMEVSCNGDSLRLSSSVSTSSMALRHISNAILRSPLAAETFRAHNSIAFGSIIGRVDDSGANDCNLALTISMISSVV